MAAKVRKKNKSNRFRAIYESSIVGGVLVCALISVIVLLLVFAILFNNAFSFFQTTDVISFFTGTIWAPFNEHGLFGVLPLLVGTLLVTVVGALIAIPIGIGCTIYVAEIADRRVKKFLKPVIELLASIPSVIYGLFAALVLSEWIYQIFQPVDTLNALNGALILSVMITPLLVSVAEEAMNSVPGSLREASYALGTTRWETIKGVVIPSALPGIVAGIVLAVGRAVGETMAVIMATGNATNFTFDILKSVQTMTAALALDVPEAVVGSQSYNSLFAVGLFLFAITFAVNIIADILLERYRERYQ